jgi:hypothetical protein
VVRIHTSSSGGPGLWLEYTLPLLEDQVCG